ncbi:iron-sulfur cluster repair di-iron protein [Nibrella saemangeumensis]|uniref:Iron-sulfur cluster repair di-iron protein n=1 Tax=Nibrella saemangeumensis TaxID=1084526 RepID=A0ABP8NST4_9BACT
MLTINNFDSDATTVGEIVAQDIRTAEIFKRLGIDFCCNGKRTLAEASQRAGVPVQEVIEKLGHLPTGKRLPSEQFDRWSPVFLADYIVNVHHGYLYENLPFIEQLAYKVASKHGERFPEVLLIWDTYEALKAELIPHLEKEERVVFPFIRQLVQAERVNTSIPVTQIGSLQMPIHVMEAEHDAAGTLLFKLRELTSDYTPPINACNTHRLLYAKLEELETDLMQHIHLENNLLFPKALTLEQELALN